MSRQIEKRTLATIRHRRHRSNSININENSKGVVSLVGTADDPMKPHRSPHYRRNYVRYRTSASRSRSRENSKHRRCSSTIDYREKLLLLLLELFGLVHLCSLIYVHHQCQPSFTVKYALLTYILINLLTFTCVQYDTQQIEHGRLQLGENPLLFLLWYGGLLGGGLALLLEKHQHLRSQIFVSRLRLSIFCNATWPFLLYVLYMSRKVLTMLEDSARYSSL